MGASPRYRRIVIIGTTSAGKSTLAKALSHRLGLPHTELDALHWEPNWTEAADEVMRQRVARALAGDAWVVDGNYNSVRDLIWPRADTLVWLDYPLAAILRRLTRRTLRRVFARELLWGTNRESIGTQFFSRDSLYVWVLRTYWRRRREVPVLLKQPEHAHLHVVRLRTPRATQRWLARLPVAARPVAGD